MLRFRAALAALCLSFAPLVSHGQNFFNKATVTEGSYYTNVNGSGGGSSLGTQSVGSPYNSSAPIGITPGQQYTIRNAGPSVPASYGIAFFSAAPTSFSDVSNALPAGVPPNISEPTAACFTFTAPAGANFMVVPMVDSDLASQMIVAGSTCPTTYSAYTGPLASLTLAAIPNHNFTDAPFALSATTNSTSPIVFSILSGPATVSGNTVTLTEANGTVVVQAAVAADNTHAANSVTVSFVVSGAPVVPPAYTLVVGQHTGGDANLVSNATIVFTPVAANGQAISYRAGGDGGVVTSQPITAAVNNGSFAVAVPDTKLTSPQNVCFLAQVIDNTSGNSLLGPGYSCLQPTGSTWSLDAYIPNLPGIALQTPGLSAYQLAQQSGFTGTLTQWLASLVGPQGQSGVSTNGWTGKAFYGSGDSITCGVGTLNNTYSYVQQVAALLGGTYVGRNCTPGITMGQYFTNNGYSGTNNQAPVAADFANVDVDLLFLGTNINAATLGSIADAPSTGPNASAYAQAKYGVEFIQALKPSMQIIGVIPYQSGNANCATAGTIASTGNCGTIQPMTPAGRALYTQVRQMLIDVYTYESVPYVDLWGSFVNAANTPYLLNQYDDIHPDPTNGYPALAARVARTILGFARQ